MLKSNGNRCAYLWFVLLFMIASPVALLNCSNDGGSPGDPFSVKNVAGKWNVYRTYAGEPERGPDLTVWSHADTPGYGVKMDFMCSSYVIPNGWTGIAGEIHGDLISLATPSATWSAIVSSGTMSGTFSDPYGSGAWRSVKTDSSQCNTYEVYGGNDYRPWGGTEGYDPSQYPYTFLGTATSTATFTGSYSYYVIVTRDFNVIHLDTVQGSNEAYFGALTTSNTANNANIGNVPDGQYAAVGENRMSGGGYVDIDASSASLSAITVHIAP